MTAPLTERERALCREAAARAVREVRGLGGAHDSPSDTAIAAKLYPDPAPEPQTVMFGGVWYRYNPEVADFEYRNGASDGWRRCWSYSADFLRTLTSLLPKRELTDEIVARAHRAWKDAPLGMTAMRAALRAVWDDIAAPAAPAPLKPQWWGAVGTDTDLCVFDREEDARDWAEEWGGDYPENAPYRVVALAEVPQP